MSISDKVHARYPRKASGRTYLGTGVASVLIALIVLVIACFAALTWLSADSKMKLAEKSRVYCDNYYAAETIASELLEGLLTGKAEPVSASGKKADYETEAGKVTVTKSGSYIAFSVPISKKQELNVEAAIKDKEARIITWAVE